MTTALRTRTSTLGGRLRAARLFAGIDQTELAAELGVSRQTISNWETGRNELPASAMIRWAETCKVSLDWMGFGNSLRPEAFEPPNSFSYGLY